MKPTITKKILGTLTGIAMMIPGVGGWILLRVFVGDWGGFMGVFFGFAFLYGYRRIVKNDYSKYPFIMTIVMIVSFTLASSFISVAIVAAILDIGIMEVISLSRNPFIIDIFISLTLAGIMLGTLIARERRYAVYKRAQVNRINRAIEHAIVSQIDPFSDDGFVKGEKPKVMLITDEPIDPFDIEESPMLEKKCTYCGGDISKAIKYCGHCGKEV